jgi:hypothetical protein
VLSAANEETFSAFGPWCAETCIGASESEGKKPHQGVAGKNPALHPGIVWSNSTNALAKDSIKTTINMDITSEGKVGIEGGMRTAYPSLEIYSYSPGGQSTSILQMQEHSPSDLAKQNQPIPEVAPQ